MRKQIMMRVRVEDSEYAAWMEMATTAGLSLSAWVRSRCNKEITFSVTGTPEIVRIQPPDQRNASGGPRWVCKCGQKNIDTAVCGRCKELQPQADEAF